jgi:N-acetyl-gamma-glutamyl-phosphate reductase
MSDRVSVGVVGARGHTGSELLTLLDRHPELDVVFAGSRELAGHPVPEIDGLTFESLDPAQLSDRGLDAVFLALPDGAGAPFVGALGDIVIVDISSDHRFSDSWIYGLPELNREKISGARQIANPGCYATAMQLSLAPFIDDLAGVPAVFGVSGYSGAGTAPGPRNNPERLADNLIPYKLVGHTHEREAARHLGHEVRFMPHVHPAFRGLITTAHIPLQNPTTSAEARARLEHHYSGDRLVDVQTEAPELKDGTGRLGVLIGGVDVSEDGRNLVVVAAEDNLLKGAAVQALQNLNLALGFDEYAAILE